MLQTAAIAVSFQHINMKRPIIFIISFVFTCVCFGQPNGKNLEITHLTGDFYVYATYHMYNGSRLSANGMYAVTDSGIILIDTPWDTTQFQPLLDSIRTRHHKTVAVCIATHFHEDRTGGLEYYRKQGIKTYTTRRTDQLSKARGMKRAGFFLEKDSAFTVGQHSFETYFPGRGHAPDNIVIWFGNEKILYGGCLIKSVADTSLGNLSDASVEDYPATLKKIQQRFQYPRFIITGHNDWTNTGSLEHTLQLAEQAKAKNNR